VQRAIWCTDDDDISPQFDWLKETRLAADSHASFSVFGGRVIPNWEIRPEKWILSWVKLGPVFAVTDPSWEEGPTSPDLFSAAIWRSARRYLRLVIDSMSISGQVGIARWALKTELNLRLARAGFKARHSKQAVVEHFIPRFKLNRGWILDRAHKFGREQYRLVGVNERAKGKFYFGIPRH